jgi:Xaa-Pro aminopeptidase
MNPLDRLRAKMALEGLTAVLVSDIVNVGWLTGFSGSSGFALVTQDQARFITDSRYTVQSEAEVSNMSVHTFASPVTFEEFLSSQATQMGITQLYFEANAVTVATLERWQQKMPDIQFQGRDQLVSPLRMVKSAEEVDRIRQACGIADATFKHVQRLIQPGVSELDLALEMEFFIRRQGAGLAFDFIVASGHRSALPHGRASEKKLENGDFLTFDFGATYEGYHSDITRTVVVGEISDRHREVYGQVLKCQLAALETMRPGVPARDVDAKAREVLDEIGLAKYFGHGLGHGLGRLVHDTGRLAATSTDVLEPGQVWTVEPGVYLPGWGGVRIEDDVLVTSDGIEILTHSPKDLLSFPA